MADVALTAKAVEELFFSCLFREGEDTSGHVLAEAVRLRVGFHPGRLEAARPKVHALLLNLPEVFQRSRGVGGSFLSACHDRDGRLWTGFHEAIDQLLALGLATGLATYCAERRHWGLLPGGMPYFTVEDGPSEKSSPTPEKGIDATQRPSA